MKALMSDKLRAIISNPQGNRELQKGVSKLNTEHQNEEGTKISVGNQTFKIWLVNRPIQDQ